jgi:hypothetical protein
MAKTKRPQLSPELREKYRTWLRAQRTAGIDYGRDESGETVVAGAPLTAIEEDGIDRWLHDVEHVDDIEFEDSDEGDDVDEDVATTNPSVVPGLLGRLGWTWNVVIAVTVLLAVALIVTFARW